jgi:hypothetical protein
MKSERAIPTAEAGKQAAEVTSTDSQAANAAPEVSPIAKATAQHGAGDSVALASETVSNIDAPIKKTIDISVAFEGAKDGHIDLPGYIHTSTGMQRVVDFETIKVTKNGVVVLGKQGKTKGEREVIFYIDVPTVENRIVLAKQVARAIAETLNGKRTTPIDWSLAD